MKALTRALAESENSYVRCCQKAVGGGANPFAYGPMGISSGPSSLNSAQEQARHFRGWVFAAVNVIAKRLAGLRICAGKKPKKPKRAKSHYETLEPLDSHPVLDLLADPNEIMTGWQLVYSMVSSMLLTGRTHVWIRKESEGLKLYYLPSHYCTTDSGGWLVRIPDINGVKEFHVPTEEMIYTYLPDPSDPLGVTSVLQTQATAVAIDESIQMAQFRAFKNGIFPSLMVKIGTLDTSVEGIPGDAITLDASQREDLVSAVKRLYGGVLNYGEPLIVDGLITGVEKLSLSPNEMDFTESADHIKARIMQAFGVNPLLLGQIEGANRAQAVVAEQSFCANVVNPLARLISEAFTQWLGEGVEIWLEPAVADDDEMKLKAWQYAASMDYVTANEFRRNVLNLEDMPGGDELSTQQVENESIDGGA